MKNTNYKQRLKHITTFIFDIDGVFTNGDIYFHPMGKSIRSLNAKDGYAVTVAVEQGFNVAIITRGDSPIIKEVLLEIGVTDVFLKVTDKQAIMKKYLADNNLQYNETLFMGDDLPDYYCIKDAGIGSCPRDAVQEIREIADYVSTFNGGKGAVRDVIEQTLRLQDKWFKPQ